jgi:PAS domain S-box-containing protein
LNTSSGEILRTILNSLGVAAALCSRELSYVWVSDPYARWFGRRVDDIVGSPIASVVGADAMLALRPRFECVLAGQRVEYEDDVTLSGPGKRRVHAVYTPTYEDGSPEPTGWIAIVRDVTTERETARAARDGELAQQLVAALVESADDAILSKDVKSVVTSWNAGAERMFGYAASEVIGKSIRLIIPDDRQGEEDDLLARVTRGERVSHFETLRRHKDGRLIPVSITVSPIRLGSGEIVGASNITRDVTEHRRAAERTAFLSEVASVLAASLDYETTLKTIANLAVPYVADWCAVDICREGGAIERLAVAHVDPTKIGLAETIRRRYEDADTPYSVPYVVKYGTPALIPDITDEMIVESARGDQDRVNVIRTLGLSSYICVPLVAHGRTMGALTLATSVSGRHYAEADLEFAKDIGHRAALAVENARAYDEAQRASRLKDEFLATLSHELRTPLNAILGYSRMLRSGLIQPDRQDKAIDTIERNASALTQIVEDVLDVSRIISGKVRLDVQPVELPQVVEHAIESIMPAANAKQIRVHTIVDPRAAPVSGDPGRLQQVMWNLLSNAVKFTPRGGQLQVRVERVNSHIELVVSDSGIGIEPTFLPYLFERFRQADAGTTRERGGLGLGLAITRHLVEMHGGTIRAASGGRDTGATFTVSLPLMIVHPPATADVRVHPQAASALLATHVPDLHGITVLALDDDRDALNMVGEILEAAGARVTTVDSAAEALNALKTLRPDVIIADIGLPHMDGFEFVSQLRQSADSALRDVPAAALTAYARSEDRARALRSGFQIHLAKPIDPSELMAAVAALARRTGH